MLKSNSCDLPRREAVGHSLWSRRTWCVQCPSRFLFGAVIHQVPYASRKPALSVCTRRFPSQSLPVNRNILFPTILEENILKVNCPTVISSSFATMFLFVELLMVISPVTTTLKGFFFFKLQ